MRTVEDIRNELDNSIAELEEVKKMSNEEACIKYNVDAKAEILLYIEEDIEGLSQELANSQPADTTDDVTEIFGSYLNMNTYLY